MCVYVRVCVCMCVCVCVSVCMCVYVYSTSRPRAKCDTSLLFKRKTARLNLDFFPLYAWMSYRSLRNCNKTKTKKKKNTPPPKKNETKNPTKQNKTKAKQNNTHKKNKKQKTKTGSLKVEALYIIRSTFSDGLADLVDLAVETVKIILKR